MQVHLVHSRQSTYYLLKQVLGSLLLLWDQVGTYHVKVPSTSTSRYYVSRDRQRAASSGGKSSQQITDRSPINSICVDFFPVVHSKQYVVVHSTQQAYLLCCLLFLCCAAVGNKHSQQCVDGCGGRRTKATKHKSVGFKHTSHICIETNTTNRYQQTYHGAVSNKTRIF